MMTHGISSGAAALGAATLGTAVNYPQPESQVGALESRIDRLADLVERLSGLTYQHESTLSRVGFRPSTQKNGANTGVSALLPESNHFIGRLDSLLDALTETCERQRDLRDDMEALL